MSWHHWWLYSVFCIKCQMNEPRSSLLACSLLAPPPASRTAYDVRRQSEPSETACLTYFLLANYM